MTALNFSLNKEQAIITMDTLVTGVYMESGEIQYINYTTKMYPIPHLNIVVCGVGNAELKRDWYTFVMEKVVAKDINYLNRCITEKLIEFDNSYSNDLSSTIFQIGYDNIKEKFVAFQYRKENDFKPEAIENNIYCHPSIQEYGEMISRLKSKEDESTVSMLIEIMKTQKAEQDKIDIEDRIGIGGEIQCLVLEKDSYLYQTIHKFNDYEDKYIEMLERVN